MRFDKMLLRKFYFTTAWLTVPYVFGHVRKRYSTLWGTKTRRRQYHPHKEVFC